MSMDEFYHIIAGYCVIRGVLYLVFTKLTLNFSLNILLNSTENQVKEIGLLMLGMALVIMALTA